MKRIALFIGIFMLPLSMMLSCKDKNKDEDETFDKGPILTNLADNYILPGYIDLNDKIGALQTAWNTFQADQSQSNFDLVKGAWETANISFHRIKIMDFGPAATVGLHAALGTFPADTTQIQNNIAAGTYALTTADNIDAIGFDALDYLLYRSNAYNLVCSSANTRVYISELITKMKTEAQTVLSAWQNGYRATFVAGTGTSSTDAFALLVNAFCRDYELVKSIQVGIPIGMQSLGIQQPHYLAARRSGLGKNLMITNIQTVWDVFRGMSYTGTDGQGFDDYLNAIEMSSLTSTVNSRFGYMTSHPNTWSGTIEQMMGTNPSTLTDFYNYMQGSVVYLKTDMSSAFGVLITYQDNDGD